MMAKLAGPTRYSDLNAVLAALVSGAQEVLGEDLVGVYLQGSFAIGDADEHSDVDFLARSLGQGFAPGGLGRRRADSGLHRVRRPPG